jgi:hypothetical protein
LAFVTGLVLLVPATPMGGLKQMIRGPEDVAQWKNLTEKYRT